jgi:hypothetical protein
MGKYLLTMLRKQLVPDLTSILLADISSADTLYFLKGAYKSILIFTILGVSVTVTYLFLAPKRHGATAHITMAQMVAPNSDTNYLDVNIEESAPPILRLASPISSTPEAVDICNIINKKTDLALSEAMKLGVSSGG